MAKKVSIDPVSRIEGHLAINSEIVAGKVVDARVAGRMFRGFEALLVGRHPVDAARLTQRICGICHEVHGIAASIALEDLYGLKPSPNGRILRDLILGLHLVTDHIFHFYQLALPDYVDFTALNRYRGKDERLLQLARFFKNTPALGGMQAADVLSDLGSVAELARGYVEAVDIRKEAGSGLASLGGKVPFCHSILPGGVTSEISRDRLMRYASALRKTSVFVNHVYLEHARLLAERFPAYFRIGQTQGNFYANGGFDLLGAPLFAAGVVWSSGKKEPVAVEKIAEPIESSFFAADGKPQQDKAGAYSWVKAMTYGGAPMEVGPLARMIVNDDHGFTRLLGRSGQKRKGSSVMHRLLARAYEAQLICTHLEQLLVTFRPGGPTINPVDMAVRPSGDGLGMSLAARGALNHRIHVEDGRVANYSLQVPSAWNFAPTVNGIRGPVEEALVGTSVASGKADESLEIGRIVRSFDPCLACAIH